MLSERYIIQLNNLTGNSIISMIQNRREYIIQLNNLTGNSINLELSKSNSNRSKILKFYYLQY